MQSLIHVRKPNGMVDRILQRHPHAVAFWTGVLIKNGGLSKSTEVQVEEAS
jgi:hypothetical protein